MPSVSRVYHRTVFKAENIQAAIALVEMFQKDLDEKAEEESTRFNYETNRLARKNETWRFDSFEEFFAEYRKGFDTASIARHTSNFKVNVSVSVREWDTYTDVEAYAASRVLLEKIFEIFEKDAENSKIPKVESQKQPPQPPTIFVGHGRNPQWRDLKDHLHEQHKYEVQAYEIGARAGHTIRDILDEMLIKSSFAILVMTAEDETAEGTFRPRMNVVHELGLFQGKLGFARAIVLLEEGTEEFSNIHGIHQIRFSKGKIRETFGDVLATLRREFSSEDTN